MSKTVAVILGAGNGSRVGYALNKVFLPLHGEPIIVRSARPFIEDPAVGRVVVVASEQELEVCERFCKEAGFSSVDVIAGGPTRHASEEMAIEFLAHDIAAGSVDILLVHDGARPLYGGARLHELIDEARRTGGAILALPMEDHLVREDTTDRPSPTNGDLWAAQTPQAFRAEPLLKAFRAARRRHVGGTDTSSTAEWFGISVSVVRGDPLNVKITYADDLVLAEAILEGVLEERP